MNRRFPIVLAIALVCACRKPPPLEIVYTGNAGGAGAGGTPATGTPGKTPDPPPDSSFKKTALLDAVAQCSLRQAQRFGAAAHDLREAAGAWAADPSEPHAQAARTAWLAAMSSWEESEIFRFGPSAPSADPGGQSLRDQIYAWPLFSRCKVEEQLVSQVYLQPAAFAATLVNGRTLSAFEFVAYYTGTDNLCSAFSAINAQGTWAALGADELVRRRAGYGAAIANDVDARAQALLAAWDPARGNFGKELATAGAGSKTYPADQDAFNAVSDALFYLHTELKDQKLGRALGINDCFEATCPEGLESRFSRSSVANLRANLIGFRKIFEGCDEGFAGLGFDDWLAAIGDGDLAKRMLAALANIQLALDALGVPIEDALTSDIAKARAVHTAVKALTDLMKTEFVSVLNLELPKGTEGDND